MEHLSKKLVNWASILDDGAREQALRTSSMPFVHPHVALMPDAHLGRGATVGSVIPTLGAIIPAAVGVDIGCGMMAVRTPFTAAQFEAVDRSALHAAISRAVPLSAGRYNAEVTVPRSGTPRRWPTRRASTRPRRSRRTGVCSWVRSVPATTSSR